MKKSHKVVCQLSLFDSHIEKSLNREYNNDIKYKITFKFTKRMHRYVQHKIQIGGIDCEKKYSVFFGFYVFYLWSFCLQ